MPHPKMPPARQVPEEPISTDSDQLFAVGPRPHQVSKTCFFSTGTFILRVLMPGTWFSPQLEGRHYHRDPNDFVVFLSVGQSLPKNQENRKLTLRHYFSNFLHP